MDSLHCASTVVVAACVALAGCNSSATDESRDPALDNYGYGWHYDYYSDSPNTRGLRVREEPGSQITHEPAYYESWYDKVRACARTGGQEVPANERRPLVIVISSDEILVGSTVLYGRYYPDTQTAVIVGTDYSGEHYHHELVHHFLEQSGFPRDRNHNHDSPLFDTCGKSFY